MKYEYGSTNSLGLASITSRTGIGREGGICRSVTCYLYSALFLYEKNMDTYPQAYAHHCRIQEI
jgi:hypothetical protein